MRSLEGLGRGIYYSVFKAGACTKFECLWLGFNQITFLLFNATQQTCKNKPCITFLQEKSSYYFSEHLIIFLLLFATCTLFSNLEFQEMRFESYYKLNFNLHYSATGKVDHGLTF